MAKQRVGVGEKRGGRAALCSTDDLYGYTRYTHIPDLFYSR